MTKLTLPSDETKTTIVLVFKTKIQAQRIFDKRIADDCEIEHAILYGRRIKIFTTFGEFLDIEAYVQRLIDDEVCYDINIEHSYQDQAENETENQNQTENKNQNQTKN